MGAKIGYVRVSSLNQNTERQLADVALDKIFEDKASARSTDRPQLKALLEYIREGDELHVHSLDRLARNLADLQQVVGVLIKRGVVVYFHKENLCFQNGGSNPMNTLLLQLLGAVAELERTLIAERRREGTAIAKEKGVHLGRRKTLTPEQEKAIRAEVANGANKKELAARFGISRQTLYNTIAEA